MDQQQIHFEVFARRSGGGSYVLQLATEDRERAVAAAEELMEGGKFVAVKVCKEMLDPDTGEYKSISILNKGAPEAPRSKAPVEDRGPPCVSPADLYHVHARDRIGRLLEGWLARNRVTPFELLHRPDLIEKLEASGIDLQHAVQKIAVPEAQARGIGVHEVIRGFQGLVDRAIERVLADQKKGLFPDIRKEGFAAACKRLMEAPERHYLLGAGVAGYIAPAKDWSDKVALLLELAEQTPTSGPSRALAFQVLELPLSEILRSRVGLADLLGKDLDLGSQLGALTRLAGAPAVEALAKADAMVAKLVPPLTDPADKLARWLDDPCLEGVRLALSKRIVQELMTVRRLRPNDAHGEIDIMRALAMALTAASGRLLPLEEVRDAFIERSKMLVASDFVHAYLLNEPTAVQEALDLVWLLENVTGGANKRQAMRWLLTTIGSLRFETEMAAHGENAAARLSRLAEIYRQLTRSGAGVAGVEDVQQRIAEVGGRVEAEGKYVATLAKASAPLAQKLAALLKLASAESAPPGPAADRAKIEVIRLMRTPEGREELARTPAMLGQVRDLLQSMDAAA